MNGDDDQAVNNNLHLQENWKNLHVGIQIKFKYKKLVMDRV